MAVLFDAASKITRTMQVSGELRVEISRKVYCFTMSNFAQLAKKPLFDDSKRFVADCIKTLNSHVKQGAKGIKILNELGFHYRDSSGELINCNNERLFEIWEETGRLKIPD